MTYDDFDSDYLAARDEGDIVVIAFTVPRLTDDENIERLGRELFAFVDHFGHRKVVVNLHDVRYLTSSVLGKLITLHRRLHRTDGRLIVCGFHDEVAEVLETSRLDEYFETADDVQTAIDMLN